MIWSPRSPASSDLRIIESKAPVIWCKHRLDPSPATIKAETDKGQVLIAASKQQEQAEIQRETSLILLEKAKIDAEAVRVAADAEAYKKAKILSADNALAQKLEAEIQIQRVWAEACANRKVPQYVLGSCCNGADTTRVWADGQVKIRTDS